MGRILLMDRRATSGTLLDGATFLAFDPEPSFLVTVLWTATMVKCFIFVRFGEEWIARLIIDGENAKVFRKTLTSFRMLPSVGGHFSWKYFCREELRPILRCLWGSRNGCWIWFCSGRCQYLRLSQDSWAWFCAGAVWRGRRSVSKMVPQFKRIFENFSSK